MSRRTESFDPDLGSVPGAETPGELDMRYSQLDMTMPSSPHGDVWVWDESNMSAEPSTDELFDEECETVWQSTLERL
jgi:hypothetical protein